ncbi:hypothetical protein VPH35_077439 [Triticum aestivum]|uniref:Uncharacterized protein n=2 Tax=Aegilops tauschii subsp. strangulata TaxID=200361 RepID=A0A453HQF3_AEGTS
MGMPCEHSVVELPKKSWAGHRVETVLSNWKSVHCCVLGFIQLLFLLRSWEGHGPSGLAVAPPVLALQQHAQLMNMPQMFVCQSVDVRLCLVLNLVRYEISDYKFTIAWCMLQRFNVVCIKSQHVDRCCHLPACV